MSKQVDKQACLPVYLSFHCFDNFCINFQCFIDIRFAVRVAQEPGLAGIVVGHHTALDRRFGQPQIVIPVAPAQSRWQVTLSTPRAKENIAG